MKYLILIILLPVAAILLLCAYLIRFKKMYGMISGYNTMTDEEKNNINKEIMGKTVSIFLIIVAALVVLGAFLFYYGKDTLGIICFMLILPAALVEIYLSQKYDFNYIGKEKRQNAILMTAGLGFFFTLVIILVSVSLFTGSKLPDYTLDKDSFNISGTYGESINYKDIKSIELKSNLPEKLSKKSGFNFNNILKGRFSSDIGEIRLYVDTNKKPFIYIKTKDEIIILNEKTNSDTVSTYKKLEAAVK